MDTLIHESGAAQMEINFLHGDAIDLADQVFLFKRTMRGRPSPRHLCHLHGQAHEQRAGLRHAHPPRAWRTWTANNLFGTSEGGNSALFMHFIAGL